MESTYTSLIYFIPSIAHVVKVLDSNNGEKYDLYVLICFMLYDFMA